MPETTRTRIGGEYEVLAKLGSGGMGEVFKVMHTRLERLEALKVLPAHLVVDSEARARFKSEALAGAQLEHDHIVTTYDFGIHDGRPFLAMSFVEGETLTKRIQREKRLSSRQVCFILGIE